MLAIPPKMQNALDMGNFEPVKTVKIVTSVLDAPVSGQTFVDVNANLANIAAKRDIEQAYPDPTLFSTLFTLGQEVGAQSGRIIYDSGGYIAVGGQIQRQGNRGDQDNSFNRVAFQTLTILEDIQGPTRLRSITVKLRAETLAQTQPGEVVLNAKIFSIRNGKMEVLNQPPDIQYNFGGGLDSPTSFDLTAIPLSPASATEHTFFFDANVRGGDQLAFVVYHSFIGALGVPRFSVKLFGEPRINNKDEFSGPGVENVELFLKADFYQYDSAPPPVLQIQYDMGETPDKVGHWSIQDSPAAMIDAVSGNRQETSIAYNAWAGDSLGAKTINLGAINPSDVSSLAISTFRRYYVLEAVFTATANGLRTHRFVAANPVFPKDSIIISNKTLPFADVVALKSTTSTSTQLDIKTRLSEVGDFSFQVFDIDDVILRYLLQSHLLNLPIEYRMGHHPNATSEKDLLLLFSGKLSDSPKLQKGLLFFKAKDYSTNLDVKIPRVDPRNLIVDRTKVRRTTKGDTHVNAMLKIFGPEARIQSRYLRTSTFAALETKLLADDVKTLWISAKDFTKETEAKKEIQFLLEITGSYLVPQEDGVLNIVIFPRLDTSVASWDDKIIGIGDVQKSGWAQTIVNLCFVEFDLYGDGKLSGLAGKNDLASQNALAPGAEQHLADRVIQTGGYLGSEAIFNGQTLGERVSKREIDHKSLGIIPYSCVTGLDQIAVQIGDYVDITTEAHLKKGLSGAINVQFMPIKKTINDDRGEISWDLAEVINIGELPTAVFTAAPTAGLPPLNVQVNATLSHDNNPGGSLTYEWDFDYDGVNFQPDATRTTAIPATFAYTTTSVGIKRIALRVTNGLGGQHITTTGQVGQPPDIRVFGDPIPIINVLFSNPAAPSIAQLTSASYGRTGGLALIEWDIGYNGTTFLSDQTGESISVPLLSAPLPVGLRVTDEDGRTAIATITLPASVNAIVPGVEVSSILTSEWFEKPNPKNTTLRSIAWNGTYWIAVGSADGTDAYILKSTDGGETWVEKPNPKNETLRSIAWNGTYWIAVGDPDATDAYILKSTDEGETWVEKPNPKNLSLFSIKWNGTYWIAVGSFEGPGGTDAYILKSTDEGETWVEKPNPKNETLRSIAWNGTYWIAVGFTDGTDAYILKSTDEGETWVEKPNPKNASLETIIWNGYIWLSVGSIGLSPHVLGSTIGENWAIRNQDIPNVGINSLAWNGAYFLVVGAQTGSVGLIAKSLSMIK